MKKVKKILPLLFCVPILCFAENSSIYVHQHGQYTYHNGGARSSSRISVGSGWTSSAGKFNRSYKDSASVYSVRTGAKTRSPVGVNVTAAINKERVYRNIFNNAKKLRKALGWAKIGNFLAGYVAEKILDKILEYFWDEEEQDFIREIPDVNYLCAIPNIESAHLVITGEQCLKTLNHIVVPLPDNYTSNDLDTYRRGLCERVLSNGAYQAVIDDILAKHPGYSVGGYFVEQHSCGFDGRPGGVWHYARLYTGRSTIKKPLTYEEFVEYADPAASANPDPWVQAAADEDGFIDLDEKPKTSVKNGTSVVSDPYTDPNTGKAQQSRFDFKTDENGNTLVFENIEERPDLTPNSPEAPVSSPENMTFIDGNDGGSGSNYQLVQTSDLCEKHPESLACQKMGSLENVSFDDVVIPTIVNEETWQEDPFLPSDGVCPEPKTFQVLGREYQLFYEPLCVFAQKIRFAVLLCFTLISAYIVFGGLRKG